MPGQEHGLSSHVHSFMCKMAKDYINIVIDNILQTLLASLVV